MSSYTAGLGVINYTSLIGVAISYFKTNHCYYHFLLYSLINPLGFNRTSNGVFSFRYLHAWAKPTQPLSFLSSVFLIDYIAIVVICYRKGRLTSSRRKLTNSKR